MSKNKKKMHTIPIIYIYIENINLNEINMFSIH